MNIEALFDQKTGHRRISTRFFKFLIVPNFIQKEENKAESLSWTEVSHQKGEDISRSPSSALHAQKVRWLLLGAVRTPETEILCCVL